MLAVDPVMVRCLSVDTFTVLNFDLRPRYLTDLTAVGIDAQLSSQ